MPVIIKEPLAGFGYWLGVADDKGVIQAHFGYKSMQATFPGKWTGTTFKVDFRYDFEFEGRRISRIAKYTANCNASLTRINSFNIEYWEEEGTRKGTIISLDGINLPLSSSTGDNLVFSSTGASACSNLTRVTYFINGEKVKYGCDETSFVFFTIPKP